jgi:hypothetical protein
MRSVHERESAIRRQLLLLSLTLHVGALLLTRCRAPQLACVGAPWAALLVAVGTQGDGPRVLRYAAIGAWCAFAPAMPPRDALVLLSAAAPALAWSAAMAALARRPACG